MGDHPEGKSTTGCPQGAQEKWWNVLAIHLSGQAPWRRGGGSPLLIGFGLVSVQQRKGRPTFFAADLMPEPTCSSKSTKKKEKTAEFELAMFYCFSAWQIFKITATWTEESFNLWACERWRLALLSILASINHDKEPDWEIPPHYIGRTLICVQIWLRAGTWQEGESSVGVSWWGHAEKEKLPIFFSNARRCMTWMSPGGVSNQWHFKGELQHFSTLISFPLGIEWFLQNTVCITTDYAQIVNSSVL